MVRGQVIWIAGLSLVLSGCAAVPESQAPTAEVTASPQVTVSAEPYASASETQTAEPSVSASTAAPAQEPEVENKFEFLLAALEIANEYPSGYDRNFFNHWIDSDGDGCNTRTEVLIQESRVDVGISGNCDVQGQWLSLYDGVTTTDPSSFDVDHMVPLKEAWDSGAYGWSSGTRAAFANDLGYAHSLVAVTASSNRSKSDRDPAQWLPPREEFVCNYAFRWLAVKYRWDLSVDSAEALQLGRIAIGCGEGNYGAIPERANVVAGPPPQPANQKPRSDGSLDPRFSSCREALANGYGDYVKGVDPEYDWYRDGDKDGVVCE